MHQQTALFDSLETHVKTLHRVCESTNRDEIDTTESIERRLGRTAKSTGDTYHDRIIDIDILLYGNVAVKSARLTIPHPLMHLREFVLEPLAVIAPSIVHPTIGKSIRQLAAELKEQEAQKG